MLLQKARKQIQSQLKLNNMGAGATDFGWGMATEAAGGIMGLALGAINDNRQYNQQTKLQGLQIRGQKEMADYQYKKQMQMWDETNYNAEMKQLEKAGLNPGLIYGMGGGAGGSTAAGTGGAVTGAHAPTGGGEAVAMAQQGMSMALMRAQKENIEADTANKKAQEGVSTATVPKLGAETANIQADTTLKGIQDSLLRNDLFEKYSTQDNRFQIYSNEAKKGIEEAKQAMIQTKVDTATADSKIQLLKATAIGQILKNALTQAETGNINQDTINKMRQYSNMIQENMRNWDKLSLEQQEFTFRTGQEIIHESDFPKQVKEALDNILIIPRLGKGGTTPIKGFRQ